MPRVLQYLFSALILALLIVAPLVYANHRHAMLRQFRVVKPGVLYRSGQMTLAGLKRVIHDHRIKTVITLRDAYVAGNPPPDLDEEKYVKAQELNHLRISPASWWPGPDGVAPVTKGVRQFCEILRDPANHPVLVHCFAGIHRTGAYCAIYRMEFEGWTNEQAIEEMKANGYHNLEEDLDLYGYLTSYRPSWKDRKETAKPR
jgi:protein tyrosine/serine phosphatase